MTTRPCRTRRGGNRGQWIIQPHGQLWLCWNSHLMLIRTCTEQMAQSTTTSTKLHRMSHEMPRSTSLFRIMRGGIAECPTHHQHAIAVACGSLLGRPCDLPTPKLRRTALLGATSALSPELTPVNKMKASTLSGHPPTPGLTANMLWHMRVRCRGRMRSLLLQAIHMSVE